MRRIAKVKKQPTRKKEERSVKIRAVVVVPVMEPLRWDYDCKYFKPSIDDGLTELSTFTVGDLHLAEYNPDDLQVTIRKTLKGGRH